MAGLPWHMSQCPQTERGQALDISSWGWPCQSLPLPNRALQQVPQSQRHQRLRSLRSNLSLQKRKKERENKRNKEIRIKNTAFDMLTPTERAKVLVWSVSGVRAGCEHEEPRVLLSPGVPPSQRSGVLLEVIPPNWKLWWSWPPVWQGKV